MSNIPIDKQVVSLPVAQELADKLESVGVDTETALYWYIRPEGEWSEENRYFVDSAQHYSPAYEMIKAPTLTEMLGMLPSWVDGDRLIINLFDCCIGYYIGDSINEAEYFGENQSIEDAAAKLMIWLIDNGHITKETK